MGETIRFCSANDGVGLAYAVHGSGPPLVRVATWLTHIDLDGRSPVWRHWLDMLGGQHTVLRYDERGCGLSDRDVCDFSLEASVRDLEAVVEAAGVGRFVLLGISQGQPSPSPTPPRIPIGSPTSCSTVAMRGVVGTGARRPKNLRCWRRSALGGTLTRRRFVASSARSSCRTAHRIRWPGTRTC